MRVILFLFVFFSIYGGLHIYAFVKIRQALTFGTGAAVSLAAFMAGMIIAPVLIRISERQGFEFLARVMAYMGYAWMGLIFFFVSVTFVLDIYRLLVHIGGRIIPVDLSGLAPAARPSVAICILLAVILTAYGAFEAFDIRMVHVTVQTDKIPKDIGRVKIVQISDVHLGLIVGERRLKKILNLVTAADPDILVSTGDLVDGQMDNLSGLLKLFREVSPKYGKFAITGNHELYAGLARSLEFIEKAGFTVLRGEGLNIAGLLTIAGVDDVTAKRDGIEKEISEKALLSSFPRESFTLLLKHRPTVAKDTPGLFDLQLSGHTHKGQIFPFSLVTKLFYPNLAGLFRLEQNSRLYVSRGSGTWGPPVRFLSPPEVTLIELVHEAVSK